MSTAADAAARQELLRRMGLGHCPFAHRTPPIARRAGDAVVPMTDEQKHIWLHSANDPDAPVYNEPITLHYHGAYDHAVFLRAFDELLRRHEAWRACFSHLDEDPIQIIRDLRADFPLVDLGGMAAERREKAALAMAAQDMRRPFDLEKAPLFRGRVIRFANDDHRLYITLHHIIFDGVSIYRVMMPELSAIYDAYAAARDHGLPEPEIRYGDYAVWQRENSRSDMYRRHLAYWQETLAGDLPVPQLPADRPRPAIATSHGAMETFDLDAPLVTRLKALGRSDGATLYMTLLSGFMALLHRYGGQEDIVIGGVTDTRRRPEMQQMIGCCLNSLPLRSRPRSDMPFRQFLAQVRGVALGAIENSDVPFERVVRTLKVHAGAARNPLFQILFSVEPPAPRFAPGWDLTQMDVSHQTAKFDLYLELDERPDGSMAARFMYGTDLFDRATILRMIGHWTTMLENIAGAPDTPLGALAMMPPREEAELIAASRGPRRAIPAITIPDMVAATAARHPDAIAIRADAESLTYAQLMRRVDALAFDLRRAGVGKGAIAGLCVSRSADMIVAALAIMACGAAYLPLDPSLPPARLDTIVAKADPVVVVTQKRLAARFQGTPKPMIMCEDAPIRAFPRHAMQAEAEDLAYVIYTSGSTGVPKGVEIRHRSVANLIRSMQREPGFTAHDILLAVTTPAFDISVLEMFLPLAAGGCVVVAGSEDVADPQRLMADIVDSRCTVMQATPATWQGLIAAGWEGRPGLRILCGGEALPPDLAVALVDRGMDLWNMYGPTETTIWSSIEHVDPARRITIGRPIDNTTMLVLDPAGRLLPYNVAGALHIGGEGLARGYSDPRLTAEAFAPNAIVGGERLYRTGDIALQRRDGRFEWLGRADGQVKIRGFRIDLGDVEAALSTHPGVSLAAVRTFEDRSGQTNLAAYLVPVRERPTSADLRDFLAQRLPAYMLPARIVMLDRMPMTSNDKIDRKALPAPVEEERGTPPPAKPPTGECETRLAAIWRDILGIEDIGAHDDFQELGGHSLLAARLMGRIAKCFGRRLPLSTLHHAPTLRLMAKAIQDPVTRTDDPRIVPIRPGEGRPLFWIDAVPNLRPVRFRALASAMADDRPMLGLTVDLARHGGLERTASLGEIATDLAEAVLKKGGRGPHFVGGWCNGGCLAYEVARQIASQGGEVGTLILLDTVNPATARSRATRMAMQAKQLATLPRGERWPFAVETAKAYISRLRRRHGIGEDEADELINLNERFMRLVNAYDPEALSMPVVLFQPLEGKLDYATGWRSLLGSSLTAIDIPGGHVSVLDQPHVAMLGRRIEERLRLVGRPNEIAPAAA